jgi:hypothetical protein
MARATLLAALLAIAGVAAVSLVGSVEGARVGLSLACAGGLALLSARRRRGLVALGR